jgi:hypothetical protein
MTGFEAVRRNGELARREYNGTYLKFASGGSL